MAAEVVTEFRLLCAVEAELATHASRTGPCRWVDPGHMARTLPGLAEAVPSSRPRPASRKVCDRSPLQVLSRADAAGSKAGEAVGKGQPMSKVGSRLGHTRMIRGADNACRSKPQLARLHHPHMTERGAHAPRSST